MTDGEFNNGLRILSYALEIACAEAARQYMAREDTAEIDAKVELLEREITEYLASDASKE